MSVDDVSVLSTSFVLQINSCFLLSGILTQLDLCSFARKTKNLGGDNDWDNECFFCSSSDCRPTMLNNYLPYQHNESDSEQCFTLR